MGVKDSTDTMNSTNSFYYNFLNHKGKKTEVPFHPWGDVMSNQSMSNKLEEWFFFPLKSKLVAHIGHVICLQFKNPLIVTQVYVDSCNFYSAERKMP